MLMPFKAKMVLQKCLNFNFWYIYKTSNLALYIEHPCEMFHLPGRHLLEVPAAHHFLLLCFFLVVYPLERANLWSGLNRLDLTSWCIYILQHPYGLSPLDSEKLTWNAFFTHLSSLGGGAVCLGLFFFLSFKLTYQIIGVTFFWTLTDFLSF